MRESDQPPARARLRALLALLGAVVLLSFLGGCARVKPWERDLLSDPRMGPDADPVQTSIDDHIYFSKEASSGGRGFGGGGCGCN